MSQIAARGAACGRKNIAHLIFVWSGARVGETPHAKTTCGMPAINRIAKRMRILVMCITLAAMHA